MEKYEINSNTLAIISISKNQSKIIENDNVYIINKNSNEIIDHSCRYFGSSYNGRHEGTKELIGINYKSPIIIEETKNIIFFPTCSTRLNNCNWISLDKIKDYKKYNKNTKIIFKNDIELEINISLHSLENQILRSTLLESVIRKRKNNINN